ncbi:MULTISPECIES: 5-oxoprolinase subunit PxpA [Burkholderia]|uniref:5-oxoprolinase subunit PxpA n=1 Tax=Burkholderia TaxID=32008 RepID=UPI000327F325|nr:MULTISPECIES: 5-oxoprolinase subunit PxpA [Burkholderia]AGK50736.1 hypothetical protein BTI_4597 [Burkholderia thailandensis MSMB121]ATF34195.1 hypothetical protein CO709_11795 [Burkholderia thailandensis]KST72645.1 hypothetical protein WS76_26005 [Burkholderia humptydooensis]KVN06823.1 hypothetical protein WT08_19565 [Burkholderia sp. MSMB1552]KWZ51473.1 hypothetical protein WS92_21830 [Burkholderia sp. MSMB1588]
MHTIDLNVDLGEGCGNDIALLEYATSINVACGWHAGDAVTMREVIASALRGGIAVGAHPSYPDRENFGRRSMNLPPEEIYAGVQYQVGAVSGITRALRGRLTHVKPHGALYNDAERKRAVAVAIVEAVRDFDSSLALFGLAGGQLVSVAREYGLTAYDEVFADRGYASDGKLLPRAASGAMIEDAAEAARRAAEMVSKGGVKSNDGVWIEFPIQTICLHGDGPNALTFARHIKHALVEASRDGRSQLRRTVIEERAQ